MLSAQQAQALHGADGDGCWNPAICYSCRSYARNRDRINQARSRKRKEGELEQIPVEFELLNQTMFGVLVVYRKAGVDMPVYAIAAVISQVLDEQMSQHLGLTDVEVFNQTMNIAHNEDVSTWVETIAQCLQEVNLQPFRTCSFRE
ncbi:MAG TPA: hypothetical protein V6C84_28795 [Coleofasciculaceae cyanobacterium]|jgi:hypothetical protein